MARAQTVFGGWFRGASLRLLASLLLVLAAPPAHADGWVLFEGSFQDVRFVDGRRETRPMRLQLVVPRETGAPGPETGTVVRLVDGRGAVQTWRVASAYIASEGAVYLATRGEASLALHFSRMPGEPLDRPVPFTAHLLRSTGGSALPVPGTLRLQPPARRTR